MIIMKNSVRKLTVILTCIMMLILSSSFIFAADQGQPATSTKEQAKTAKKDQATITKEEPSAATVNGEKIPMSELSRSIRMAMMTSPELRNMSDKASLDKLRDQILDDLINQEIMFQEGKKLGLEPKDSEVEVEMAKIKQGFPSQVAFEQTLKQQGLTEKNLRILMGRVMTMRKLIDVKIKSLVKPITDKDISDFYETHKSGFVETEKVNARHILIKVAPNASDQEKADAKSKIQAILEEAKGGSDFAELAKKNSQCPSAPQGGDLGYFDRTQMVKPFADAVFALKPGQISDIIETEYGYHIALVQDKKPGKQLTLEEVSDRIKGNLSDKGMNDALAGWLKPIREKVSIKILLGNQQPTKTENK